MTFLFQCIAHLNRSRGLRSRSACAHGIDVYCTYLEACGGVAGVGLLDYFGSLLIAGT